MTVFGDDKVKLSALTPDRGVGLVSVFLVLFAVFSSYTFNLFCFCCLLSPGSSSDSSIYLCVLDSSGESVRKNSLFFVA